MDTQIILSIIPEVSYLCLVKVVVYRSPGSFDFFGRLLIQEAQFKQIPKQARTVEGLVGLGFRVIEVRTLTNNST